MWTFKPLFKTTIWGGDRIAPYKGLCSPDSVSACMMPDGQVADMSQVGESWEISGVAGDESVVASGPDAGMTLPELLRKYGASLLGRENFARFGDRFPLLIKFIDAKQDLSVQVHPDDALAQQRGMANGKTEMWYVVDSDPGAKLANGFNRRVDRSEYAGLVESGKIEEVLNFCAIKPGDVYFIPAGRVHAIGAGSFVCEIQQTSDATYRIYDYHRKDKNGNERQLHTELALDAINFDDTDGAAVKYDRRENEAVCVVRSPFFTTDVISMNEPVTRDYSELDSFVVLICTDGEAVVECGARSEGRVTEDQDIVLRQGETVLLPASAGAVTLRPQGNATLIETYIA